MEIVILGAGGLAREVFAALLSAGETVAGFYVEPGYSAGTLCGLPIHSDLMLERTDVKLVIAVGDGRARRRLAHSLSAAQWATVRHHAAVMGPGVSIGEGAMILGPCSATTDVVIGAHTLVNPGCTLAHDCAIGAFVNLGPSVALAGGVTIDDGASIGIGASVAPGCHIGAWAVVGAGAVVIRNVAAGDTVVGVPARILRADQS